MANWANLLGYQAAWFATVWSAGRGMPWLGVLACAAFLALQLGVSRRRGDDARVLVAALACGLSIEAGLSLAGLLQHAATPPGWPAPAWIVALWGAFALTLNHSMAWFARHPWTAAAFAGVGADWGTVTFGRQKGAPGFLADWTDVSLSDGYGNEALGAKTDTFATNRAGSVLKYSGLFSGFQVDTSYKFDGGDTEETTSKDSDAAYGAAVAYTFPFNLSLGTAYNVGIRDKSGEEDAKLWLLSAKYDNKALYAALSYADGSDFLATGKDHTGWEGALGYNFENGFGLMALWTKQKVEQAGKSDYDSIDYYTLGAQYKFNKNLRVIGEYRINNLDSHDSGKLNTKDDFQLAARYDF